MKKSRLLSLLLVLVMVLGMLPGPALAVEAQEGYATVEQLEAAFEKVGETDDVDAALAALDAYLAVYDRLSEEDQAANAEALAMAQAYRETLVAGKEAEEDGEDYEDPGIETLENNEYDVSGSASSEASGVIPGRNPVVLTKKADKTEVQPGETVTYTVTIQNLASSTTLNLEFEDNMDEGLTMVEDSFEVTDGGTLMPAEGDDPAMIIIRGGKTATVTYQATVGADVKAGTKLVNTFTATDVSYAHKTGTDSATVTVVEPESSVTYVDSKVNVIANFKYGDADLWDTVTENYSLSYVITNPNVPDFKLEGTLLAKDAKESTVNKPGLEWNLTLKLPQSYVNNGSSGEELHGLNKMTITANYTPVEGYVYGFASQGDALTAARERPNQNTCDRFIIGYGSPAYAYVFNGYAVPQTAIHTYYDEMAKANENGTKTATEMAVYSGDDAWRAVKGKYTTYSGEKYICISESSDFTVRLNTVPFRYDYVRAITVTWLKEDGTQIKQVTIPNGDDSYKDEYPTDQSTTGKWGDPETDGDDNITIRWEEPAQPEIVTKTVRIFKYFVGPTVEQVQAIKDNFSITYTYVLNGQTETKTLYGRDVTLSTEFHDGNNDNDAYLGLPVLYWDVQLKMNKDSTPQNESDAGMISFTESGKEVTGWTWYDFDVAEGWENETGFSKAQPIYDGHISIGLGNYYKGSKEITIQKLFNGEGLTEENLPGGFALNLTQYVNGTTNKTLLAKDAEKITVDGKPGYRWKVSADVLAAYNWTYCYVEEENTTINGYTLTGTSGWEAEDWDDGIDHHYFMVTPAGDQVFTIINSYKKDTVTPDPEKVTVTFKDGYDNTEIPDSKITDWTKGEDVPEDRYPTVPVHEDKDFDGWEVETDGDGNITITAKWKDKTVTPDPEPDPEPEEPTPTYYTVIYTDGVAGEEIFPDQVNRWLSWNEATPAFNGTPEREGWTFLGWSPAVADRVRGSVTYVAQWQENEPIVTPGPVETDEGEDLEENDTPLTEMPELPGETEGDSEPEEPNTPLPEAPEEGEESEELEEDDVPLADVPQTGDGLWFWVLMTLCSAAGLIVLVNGKKCRETK